MSLITAFLESPTLDVVELLFSNDASAWVQQLVHVGHHTCTISVDSASEITASEFLQRCQSTSHEKDSYP